MILNFRHVGLAAGLVAAAVAVTPAPAQAVVIFSDNFNSGIVGAEWSTNVGTLEVDTASNAPNEKFLGADDALELGLSNQTAILTLNGLGAHSEITLTFDLYILLTMDGDEVFNLSVDGVGSIVTAQFENLTPGGTSTNAIFGVADAINSLGVVDGNFGAEDDAAYRDKAFTFAHSASSLVARFNYNGLQDLTDEGWSIDNVRVAANIVEEPAPGPGDGQIPEPATLALSAIGFMAVGLAHRRRRP